MTLSVATVLLVTASAAVELVVHELGTSHLGTVRLFDMNEEGNVPAWFSGALLLACAVAMGLISAHARTRGDPDARAWGALAILVGAASLDEVASIHETIGAAIGGEDDASLYLVPGILVLLLVVAWTHRVVRRLPGDVRNLLCVGAAVWVFGAVILELVQAALHGGGGGLTGALLGTAQDAFELTGLIIVLHALMLYGLVRGYATTLTV